MAGLGVVLPAQLTDLADAPVGTKIIVVDAVPDPVHAIHCGCGLPAAVRDSNGELIIAVLPSATVLMASHHECDGDCDEEWPRFEAYWVAHTQVDHPFDDYYCESYRVPFWRVAPLPEDSDLEAINKASQDALYNSELGAHLALTEIAAYHNEYSSHVVEEHDHRVHDLEDECVDYETILAEYPHFKDPDYVPPAPHVVIDHPGAARVWSRLLRSYHPAEIAIRDLFGDLSYSKDSRGTTWY